MELFAVGTLRAFESLRNGSIVFSTKENSEFEYFILDNVVQERLIQRFSSDQLLNHMEPTILPTLQSVDEKLSILSSAEDKLIAIFAVELFGIKLYELRFSDVPEYACKLYYSPSTTPQEKTAIKLLTDFLQEDENSFNEINGKYVIFRDGVLQNEVYEDVPELCSVENTIVLRIGTFPVENSQRYYRLSSSTRNIGGFVPQRLYQAHYTQVSSHLDKNEISKKNRYVHD